MTGKNSVTVGTWYWTLRWIIGILTIVGNGIVIFLIVRHRRLRTTPPNLYILSLAVADFCAGLFIIPFTYACTFEFYCRWSLAKNFYNLLFYVSVGNLCLMTADRYLAVVHPFRYVASYTAARKVACFIALAWLIPTALSLVTLAWMKASVDAQKKGEIYYRMVRVFLLEVIPCTAMIVIYFRIFRIARRHARQMSYQRARALTVLSNSSAPAVGSDLSLNQISIPKDTSTAKATATVVGFFVFCWILSAGRSFCNFFHFCSVPSSLVLASRLLMLSNSAVNPVIYALMKKDIGSEMKDSFKRIWRKFV